MKAGFELTDKLVMKNAHLNNLEVGFQRQNIRAWIGNAGMQPHLPKLNLQLSVYHSPFTKTDIVDY